jgi:hypothetical protein
MQENVTLPTHEVELEKRDTFRKATIVKFFPQSNYGFVKDEHNTEIYFHYDEMRFVGEKRDKSFLVEAHGGPFVAPQRAPVVILKNFTPSSVPRSGYSAAAV